MADRDVAVWEATEAFAADGITVNPGDSFVAGHPIMKGRKHLFRPQAPMYDHLRDKAEADERAAQAKQAVAAVTASPDKATKDELVAIAEEQGVDASGTKAEIAERIEAEAE
jgi:SAP domain-containing new25